jgi:hypothetical protein
MGAAPIAALLPLLLLAAAPARAERPGTGPRPWVGPALALDPAFAAVNGGLDWFLSPRAALGVALAQTLPGTGDEGASESSYAFASLVGRLRAPLGERWRAELLGGLGLARIRFGSPGAHTELAPDLALGGALGWVLGGRWEVAAELAAHVTLGERWAARNPAHTSEIVALVVRWGAE